MGTLYAVTSDLKKYALPAETVDSINGVLATDALQRSSDKATGQLKKRYTMPLSSWGADLRGAVSEMAAWDLLVLEAFDAADQGNVYKYRAEKAWEWIVDVSNGDGELADVVDATPTVNEGSVSIVTSPKRGW